jgi:predicted molibdopterin-dependent oxidoreductase YjgC
MIASELAVHLGGDLGLDSVGDVWDEVERLAPAYRGITRAVLDAPGAGDGIVAPLRASAVALSRRAATAPLDPIAVPGVESVERQGAPPRAGLAESPTAGLGSDAAGAAGQSGDVPVRPEPLVGPVDLAVPRAAARDSYSLRLVASRTLYDLGAAVSAAPALAGLVAPSPLRVHPADLDALGVPAGGSVRVRTSNNSTVMAAVPDPSLPRKVVAADFNVPLDDGTIADLIDTGAPVVELRMETP